MTDADAAAVNSDNAEDHPSGSTILPVADGTGQPRIARLGAKRDAAHHGSPTPPAKHA